MPSSDAPLDELNPLQIFLLVLVKAGVASPYDLLTKAGLGAGLTSPSLKRLERAGLVRSTPGPRNRLRYTITPEGDEALRVSMEGDQTYWASGKADIFESLPRGIVLAWLHGGAEEASRGVTRAATKLMQLSQSRRRKADELYISTLPDQQDEFPPTPGAGELIAFVYQWIKAESDARQYEMQAHAAEMIASLVKGLPSPPKLLRGTRHRR